ncbi:MAG: futalosine hydrolase [Nitrospirae bacterium]|nr:futalosine hydrolase [Nitrospirota bacterium]
MKFIALLSSMPFESEMVLASLTRVRAAEIAAKKIYKGELSGHDIILMHTGIGKVNAAHSATCLIEHFPVKQVINIGVGGAYPASRLGIGDIAVATKEIYGDEGIAGSNGWKGMDEIGIPLVKAGRKKYFNKFRLDKSLKGATAGLVARHSSLVAKSGAFITVSATSGTLGRAGELERRFRAICENMEGAAIAHVCAIYDLPLFEMRGISNIAGVRDKRKWNLGLAADNCQRAVLEMIQRTPC